MDGKELAKIGIGEIELNVDGNIIKPFRRCYIITTAGQIWDIVVDAFGANNTNLDALWRLKREAWVKR